MSVNPSKGFDLMGCHGRTTLLINK